MLLRTIIQRMMMQRTNATTNDATMNKCYNEQCYNELCYNERRYNESMLQRTVLIKIRMLQRTPMNIIYYGISIVVFSMERLFTLFMCIRLFKFLLGNVCSLFSLGKVCVFFSNLILHYIKFKLNLYFIQTYIFFITFVLLKMLCWMITLL